MSERSDGVADEAVTGPGGLDVVEQGPEGAPLVVLVHGSMDRASGMRRVASRLRDDFRVVVYDRRGYGRSIGVGGPFGIDEQVADLVGVIDGRPAIVFGHSLGGDVALAAAERRPDVVRAVGSYEAPMSWTSWWPDGTAGGDAVRLGASAGPEVAAEAFARRMIGDRIWDRLPEATRAERLAEGAALVGELDDLRRRPPYDAARITVPVLVARGERGAAHHRDGTKRLVEALANRPGPAACRVVVVPDVGHGIHLEQPDVMADLVRELAAMATETGEAGERPAVTER